MGRNGRPGRLEITTAAGQLTLHPDPDGISAHGNVLTADGVRPLILEWSERHWFEGRQDPVTAAAMLRALRGDLGMGEFRLVPGLHVDDGLRVWRGERGVERLTETRWSIAEADGFRWEMSLDDDGLPIFEAGTERSPGSEEGPVWPLEIDGPADEATRA